jgi:uncharacterized protein (DUF39 family)
LNGFDEKKLEHQQNRDVFKILKCQDRDITVIVVPYSVRPVKMQEFIINEYFKLSGKRIQRKEIDWKLFNLK